MDPITRPFIIKDKIDNPKFLSGIIVIAQSHISVHYEIDSQRLFFDIFSCMPFDYENISMMLSSFGKLSSNILIPRGTKHSYKIKEDFSLDEVYKKWQSVINE